jgi:FkbM family methyltransferase
LSIYRQHPRITPAVVRDLLAFSAGKYLLNSAEVIAAYDERRTSPALRFRNGFEIHHVPEDPVLSLFVEIFAIQSYTRDFYCPQASDTIIDIGANIGVFAAYLSSLAPGIHIHCFEPSSQTYARLRKNMECSGLQELVTTFNLAVFDSECRLFLKDGASSGNRSFFERMDSRASAESVRTINLPKAIQLTGAGTIDLLKIDTEGSEIEILEGGKDADWNSILRVVVEFHDFMRHGSRDRVIRALERYGFDQITVIEDAAGAIGIIRADRKRNHAHMRTQDSA